MTAFTTADLPASITTIEQLAVWAGSILAEVNPTLTATAILSLALSIQSNPLALIPERSRRVEVRSAYSLWEGYAHGRLLGNHPNGSGFDSVQQT